jgi:Putative zincin peptidase
MIIPGFLITWLTFPGVIIHELAHQLFCLCTGTPVRQVCYFRFGNPAGFVIHDRPSSVWRHILIGIGPLFVNTALGFTIGLTALPWRENELVFGVLMWLAVSIAMHSFPSTGDAKSIWAAIWHREAPLSARILATPLVGLIFVGAIGSFFWLDLAYGFGVVTGIPRLMGLS